MWCREMDICASHWWSSQPPLACLELLSPPSLTRSPEVQVCVSVAPLLGTHDKVGGKWATVGRGAHCLAGLTGPEPLEAAALAAQRRCEASGEALRLPPFGGQSWKSFTLTGGGASRRRGTCLGSAWLRVTSTWAEPPLPSPPLPTVSVFPDPPGR